MAEWLGQDWEDELDVTKPRFREVHFYCDSEEGFQNVVAEWTVRGDIAHAVRVIPIGPWCVRWWDRYESGFRMELEVGEP